MSMRTVIWVVLGLAGCTPMHLVKLPEPPPDVRGEIVVHREGRVALLAVPAIVGVSAADRARLWVDQLVRLRLPAGRHEIYVRSNQADRPFRTSVELHGGETLCLRVFPNRLHVARSLGAFAPLPANAAVSATYYAGHAFLLEAIDCASGGRLVARQPPFSR